jgi:peroxiredoxin
MIARIKEAWRRLRARYRLALAFDVALILLAFWAVHAWQTRDLPIEEPAPDTVLATLGGDASIRAIQTGKAGVVYFFAPWCFYCRSSIGNLHDLVANGAIAWGTVVALDYGDADEVRAFIDKTGVSLPVLLGDARTAADWGVRAFPTYFVIDAQGRIVSRSVGYSTGIGLRVRTWLAE